MFWRQDHYHCLLRAISRATLISGASVLSGSASAMNGCYIPQVQPHQHT